MKNTFTLLFILLFVFFKSQEKPVETEVKSLDSDKKAIYELLKECIILKAKDKNLLYIFPEVYVIDNSRKVQIGAYYYDQNFFQEDAYNTKTATYYAMLTFEKIQPDPPSLRGRPSSSPNYGDSKNEKPYFSIHIQEPESNSFRSPKTVLFKSGEKPLLKESYGKKYFYSSSIHSKVNPEIYTKEYSHSTFANKNFIVASDKNYKYGVESSKGEIMIPFEYNYIWVLANDFLVKKDSKYFILNSKNQKISQDFDYFIPEFNYSSLVSSNPELQNIYLVRFNEKTTFIGNNFKVIKPLIYEKLQFFNSKPLHFLGSLDGKQVVIDYQTFKEITPRYDNIIKFDKGIYQIHNNGKTGLTYIDNKPILECIYDKIEIPSTINFQQPETWKLILEKDKKFAVFNFGEKLIITKFEYDEIRVQENYIKVKKDGKFGVLDLDGKIITPIKFDSISWNQKTKQTEAVKKGEISVLDSYGKIIL